jgi:hypothetical protein
MTQEPATVGAVIERALGAYGELATLGETIDDEWSYVQDLTEAWRASLEAVAVARGDGSLDSATTAAVDALIDEARRITDPNRAIDWLSTFPQVTLLALGELG